MALDPDLKKKLRTHLPDLKDKTFPSPDHHSLPTDASAKASPLNRSSRRDFSTLIGVSTLTAQLGTISPARAAEARLNSKAVFPEKRVASTKELLSGEIVDFSYPAQHQAFVVALDKKVAEGIGPNENIVAYHRACPHMGCSLTKIDAQKGQLGPCRCHLSLFDLENGGLQVHGMASQPLVRVLLELRGDDVYAVGILGLPYGEALSQDTVNRSPS